MGIQAEEFLNHIIKPTLALMGREFDSPAAAWLLLGTAAHESHLGQYLKQLNGPALGVYQMEPTTFDDIWSNYIDYRSYLEQIGTALCGDEIFNHECVVHNLRAATFMARIHYYRVPEPLPAPYDMDGLAAYWKQHYNTPAGRGTVGQFVNNFPRKLHREVLCLS